MVAPVPWGRGEQWDGNYIQAQENTAEEPEFKDILEFIIDS